MVKQSAVEWLELQLLNLISFNTAEIREEYRSKFEQAKQMEARQKIDLTEICKCDSTGATWVCNCCGRPYIEKKVKV